MSVWIFNYASITDHGTNPRLLGYYEYLKKQGQKPCFFFLKKSIQNPSYNIETVRTNNAILNAVIAAWKLARIKRKPTIYIYSSHIVYFPVYLICGLRQIPLIIEKTELDSVKPLENRKDLINKWLYQLDEIISPLFASRMVVISTRLKEYYEKKNNDVSLVGAFVPYHSLKAAEEHHEKKDKFTIGYLGSFGLKDDLKTLLEAFQSVHKEHPNCQLKLIGHVPAELKRSLEHLPVIFHELIHAHEIHQTLMRCDLLVCIRKNTTYSDYGFPSKLAEYLATAKPVICSRSSDIPELLKHNHEVIMIDPESPDQLQSSIQKIINDSELGKQIGESGYQWAVARWHPDKVLSIWYSEVIQPT